MTYEERLDEIHVRTEIQLEAFRKYRDVFDKAEKLGIKASPSSIGNNVIFETKQYAHALELLRFIREHAGIQLTLESSFYSRGNLISSWASDLFAIWVDQDPENVASELLGKCKVEDFDSPKEPLCGSICKAK